MASVDDINTLKEITTFSVQFRKSYDELEDIVKICNTMLLKGNYASITYSAVGDSKNSRVFRIKIYRCRQTFSSLVLSGMLKYEPERFMYFLSISNLVLSSNGFVQFKVENPEIDPNQKSIPGPILHITLYEPKDKTKAKILSQAIDTINSAC